MAIEKFFVKINLVCAMDGFYELKTKSDIKRNFAKLYKQIKQKSKIVMLYPLTRLNMFTGFLRTLYKDNRTPEQTILINEVKEFVYEYIFKKDRITYNLDMLFEERPTSETTGESYQNKLNKRIEDCSLDNCQFSDIRFSDNESLNNLSTCSFSERYYNT